MMQTDGYIIGLNTVRNPTLKRQEGEGVNGVNDRQHNTATAQQHSTISPVVLSFVSLLGCLQLYISQLPT